LIALCPIKNQSTADAPHQVPALDDSEMRISPATASNRPFPQIIKISFAHGVIHSQSHQVGYVCISLFSSQQRTDTIGVTLRYKWISSMQEKKVKGRTRSYHQSPD
jgi:hypothetical protein